MTNIIDKIRVSGTDYTLSATSSGGNPTVELTQAEYDALVSAGTVSADTYYIITDAQAGDLTQYWTSAQTNSAITQATSGKVDTTTFNAYSGSVETALSGKQDTLVSGTNIKTINNQSLLGSGNIDIQGGGGEGKSVEAGRGISVESGDSAYTVSFNLPMSAGTGNGSILENRAYESTGVYAHAEGDYTHAKGSYSHAEGGVTYATDSASHAEGYGSSATSMYSHAEGDTTKTVGRASHTEGTNTIANNISEHASGQYNVSSSGSSTFGDSGNTLFSVGNGTSTSARHNAFEIRQNGDIYLSSGGTDIKLQDHLGGGGGGGGTTYSAGTNIDITNDTINCTLPIREGSNSSGKGIIVGDSECTANGLYGISLGHSSDADGAYSFCNGSNSYARGQMSFAYGSGCDAKNDYAFMLGYSNVSTKQFQFSYGRYVNPKNELEFGFGIYNNSSSASTTFGHSGNTLFSIGNGYDFSSTHNWHNAFEVRQNGDIYIPNTNDTSVTGDYAYSLYPMVKLQDVLDSKQTTLTAGTGISIVDNVISATGGGGGGGMTEDDELLLATALTDLNDRKIDASEVKSNYQKKGDYVTTNTLNTRLAEYETALDEQNVEEVTAYALNDLNERFGGLKIVKITESEYAALTTKDENTLYVVVADQS